MEQPPKKGNKLVKAKKEKPESGVVPEDDDKKTKKVKGIPVATADSDEKDTKPKKKKIIKKKTTKTDKDSAEKKDPKKKKEVEEGGDDNNSDSDAKEEKKDTKKAPAAAAALKKVPSSFPKYQKKECDEETRKKLEKTLKDVNDSILHFKNLGYITRANGTLYYPAKVKLEATGIKVKITIQGPHFIVDTDGDRTGNDIIKALEGKWIGAIKVWRIPIYKLKEFKECFDVVEEKELSKAELEKLREEIKEKKESKLEPGVITVEDNGTYLSLTSTNFATKTISQELKTQCQARWRPEDKAWIVAIAFKKELDEILETAKNDEIIEDFQYTQGLSMNASEDD